MEVEVGERMNEHGILHLVARVDGGPYYTIKQVAERLGKSTDTIRRWVRDEVVPAPSHKMDLGEEGKSFVWLYTEDDIEVYEAYSTITRPGRPRRRT